VWRCLLALVACELGRRDEARQVADEVARRDLADLPRDLYWLCNVALLSESCARLGDAGLAGTLAALLAPYAALNVMAGRAACLGAVARYLGLLAATRRDWIAAARHFEDALTANTRMGARPLVARTAYDYAAMLLERRDEAGEVGDDGIERARAMLVQAHATATELGMVRLADESHRLLDGMTATAGAASSPPHALRFLHPPAFPNGLTAREAGVLRLLAAGRSNPEIAGELVISVKTVERHTVNIYAKIGARNRVDAAAYAFRHGLC
jgi:ATP/maltotriose-dependent transcriptional regulator MalT